jgi:hypothetical protein
MSQQPAGEGTAPPEVIYLIRHGEKPADPHSKNGKHGGHPPEPAPPFGVDAQGSHNPHGLLPRGWQRSGALTVLLDPARSSAHDGLRTPAALLCPTYGDPAKTATHRTYQTIQGLASQLGLDVGSPFEVGHESRLAASVVSEYSGVVLICWDHHHIPVIASELPTAPGTAIPGKWPDERYDVIWAFTLLPGSSPATYAFTQVPQRLLPGDTDTIIPV